MIMKKITPLFSRNLVSSSEGKKDTPMVPKWDLMNECPRAINREMRKFADHVQNASITAHLSAFCGGQGEVWLKVSPAMGSKASAQT